jgi:hypothetical protein
MVHLDFVEATWDAVFGGNASSLSIAPQMLLAASCILWHVTAGELAIAPVTAFIDRKSTAKVQ